MWSGKISLKAASRRGRRSQEQQQQDLHCLGEDWPMVFSHEIPTDVVVEVGEANFSLHKFLTKKKNERFQLNSNCVVACMQFMLVAKSNYIRKLIMDTKEPDLTRIDLSDIFGGPEIFEKAAKFCFGVNFEITVNNVAALCCAAEYLRMTDKYCDNNLAGHTEDPFTLTYN
ncbi:Root phototropism protein 2 [Morella rubra]|uniref:Root phototropism protein 2 n=1 Tax=Morella rubra TaxID=262757 RepID=A0A6A1VD88_9ROSI|nr:Root phototropism protein 2 [Morella rubra]KAB1210136.1 Root phototropism protein 2 [Morella rubra]